MKVFFRTLLLASISYLLAGCDLFGFGTDNAPAPTPLSPITLKVAATSQWSKSVGMGTEGQYIRLLVDQDDANVLYTADDTGFITATQAKTGDRVWKKDLSTTLNSGPRVGDGRLVVGANDGKVYALSSANGNTLWQSELSTPIWAPVSMTPDTVLVKSSDGTLSALSAADGKLIWNYQHGAPVMILRLGSAPQSVNGKVIAGFSDGRLVALNAKDGSLLWEQMIAAPGVSEVAQMVDIDTDPLIADSVIYIATYQGQIAAVRLSDGQILWQHDISTYVGLVLTKNHIVVVDTKGHLTAFSRKNGHLAWNQSQLAYRILSPPALSGDDIVVGDAEGYLHWINENSGMLEGRILVKKEDPIVAPVVVKNGFLYVVSSKGKLYCFKEMRI